MRTSILSGYLPLPAYDQFAEAFPHLIDTIESMWASLWHNYCANKGGTSAIYWSEQFGKGNTEDFIAVCSNLRNWLIIVTKPAYSSLQLNESKLLEFVTSEELEAVRHDLRFYKYLPIADTTAQHGVARVRANGKAIDHTLNRPGMEVGAKSTFGYDRAALNRHFDDVVKAAGKGMEDVFAKYPELRADEANYGNVTADIIAYLAQNNVTCNMGINQCDTRGRAIKAHLSKVGNPIGFKPFRALITIPAKHRKLATVAGRDAIIYFVAELNGYKKGTVTGKYDYGFSCWINNVLPHKLHERIWCERLYQELTSFQISQLEGTNHYWSTPIELDDGASLLQYVGLLLGDQALLQATNVITDGDLVDPWGITEGVSRDPAKVVLMRKLYGSSLSAVDILQSQTDVEWSMADIPVIEDSLTKGAYGVANKLKEFVIGNANMSALMSPIVWGEELVVPCNRHVKQGEAPHLYNVLDANFRKTTVVHWSTIAHPDLKSFKRWTQTGLI